MYHNDYRSKAVHISTSIRIMKGTKSFGDIYNTVLYIFSDSFNFGDFFRPKLKSSDIFLEKCSGEKRLKLHATKETVNERDTVVLFYMKASLPNTENVHEKYLICFPVLW